MMDKLYISSVPCLLSRPDGRARGTVLLVHGWGSTMESYAFFASLLTDWGYKVIVPELPHHGERGALDYADPAVLENLFWDVVQQGMQEASDIVAELYPEDGCVAMVGHSTGGFITAGTFARDAKIKTAVVINGSCAWVKFEETYREQFGAPAMEESRRAELAAMDPLSRMMHHADAFEERSLLLLHGSDDQTVPIDSQQYFMSALAGRNIPETRLKFTSYPRVNHHITIGMLQAVKEWLHAQSERG